MAAALAEGNVKEKTNVGAAKEQSAHWTMGRNSHLTGPLKTHTSRSSQLFKRRTNLVKANRFGACYRSYSDVQFNVPRPGKRACHWMKPD
jgi:hypothetical protein